MRIKELKRIEENEEETPIDRMLKAAIRDGWNRLVEDSQGVRLVQRLTLATDIWIRILGSYTMNYKAVKLAEVNRAHIKRYMSTEANGIDFTTFVIGLCESKTIPAKATRTPSGGWCLIPHIVIDTAMSRSARGEKEYDDLIGISQGTVKGPVLSEAGARKLALFENFEETVDVPIFVTAAKSSTPASTT